MARRPSPIDEHSATGETARIYHDIRQTLRISGVNLNFRTWAGFERFFPRMWHAIVQIPTMILWGAEDRFQPVEYGRRLADDIPGARFEPIPKARHFVIIDRPRAVLGLLRDFLSAHNR